MHPEEFAMGKKITDMSNSALKINQNLGHNNIIQSKVPKLPDYSVADEGWIDSSLKASSGKENKDLLENILHPETFAMQQNLINQKQRASTSGYIGLDDSKEKEQHEETIAVDRESLNALLYKSAPLSDSNEQPLSFSSSFSSPTSSSKLLKRKFKTVF